MTVKITTLQAALESIGFLAVGYRSGEWDEHTRGGYISAVRNESVPESQHFQPAHIDQLPPVLREAYELAELDEEGADADDDGIADDDGGPVDGDTDGDGIADDDGGPVDGDGTGGEGGGDPEPAP